MATSSTAAKTSYHTRSISLPSRAHPQEASIEDQLSRLKSSSTASTSSSSSVCHNLSLLSDLYQSFDDLLQSPHAQQALSQFHHVEKALDGSVKLLDICNVSKDALLITKEILQKLESSFRRRSGQSAHADELQNIQALRKNVKRIVRNCSKNLSKMESCKIKMEIQGQDFEHVALFTIVREVEAVSLSILESTLSFLFGTEAKSLQAHYIKTNKKERGSNREVGSGTGGS